MQHGLWQGRRAAKTSFVGVRRDPFGGIWEFQILQGKDQASTWPLHHWERVCCWPTSVIVQLQIKAYAGKLRSRWIGPFFVTHVHPHGVVELQSLTSTNTFKVNGHCLKLFHETPQDETVEEITLQHPHYPQAWRGSISSLTFIIHIY